MTIRVLVVDDQEMTRVGLEMMLAGEGDIAVVGQAANGQDAIAATEELRPDVVLMDVRMPVMDGIEATARIACLDPAPHVIVLTTFDLDEYVFTAFRAGASGFLLKDASRARIVEAVRAAHDGDALIAPSVTRRLVERFARNQVAELRRPDSLDHLTDRESEILLLIARGLSNGEIATRLVLSESTVKTHVGRILHKLALRDRVQAVVLAYEAGLIAPGAER